MHFPDWLESLAARIVAGLVVLVTALVAFLMGLAEEPPFLDESAHVRQTYYYQLLRAGRWHDPDWVHAAAYDHPPVYKYILGWSLERAGLGTPRSTEPWVRWMHGPGVRDEDLPAIQVARWPIALAAVAGCLAMYLLGCQLGGTATGLATGLVLVASPLYATHARRAMADDLAMCFTLWGLVTLIAAQRASGRGWATSLGLASGIAFGLAAETRLNVAVVPIAAGIAALLATGTGCFLSQPVRSHQFHVFLRTLLIGAVTLATFIVVNPYLTAQPELPDGDPRAAVANMHLLQRTRWMLEYRMDALDNARQFENLRPFVRDTTWQRLCSIANGGFLRYAAWGGWLTQLWGPDWGRDRPSNLVLVGGIALLLTAWGGIWSLRRGFRELHVGRSAVHWIPVVGVLLEGIVLTQTLVLDFDRYHLGVVVWVSLLVPLGLLGPFQAGRATRPPD